MKRLWLPILTLLLSLVVLRARASHIVGGEFTYKYLGDTTIGTTLLQKYQVSLSIYEDCLNGQPDAIAQDNPAYFSVYPGGSPTPVYIDTNVYYSSSVVVPANFSNACITNVPPVCLLKKTFLRTYLLPPNPTGYVVSYQRCCRNASVMNILDPGDNGSTYFCAIPYIHNNCAVFKYYPPQIICINNPLYYDHSAFDADGDSLSYEFCPALLGAGANNIKPVPGPPPYDSVSYFSPFSANNPITGFPPIVIDPVTGIITGTPNRLGRFLVTVCCTEWRDGVKINVSRREFQFVVTDCSRTVIADFPQLSDAPNTYVVNCLNYKVHFINTSKGGFAYKWDFGVPTLANDTSTAFEPDYVYPDTGTYSVKLVVNPGTTCPDSISRFVKIYPVFRAGFNDSGRQCPGSTIAFQDASVATIKPITYWKWTFGDGDSSFDQNPVHSYTQGGTYNVTLISENARNCRDTAVVPVVIDDFKPFAGDDTIIVKGEYIVFDAHGGIKYRWSPGTNLSDTTIFNPVGSYPDTGQFTYYLYVQSEYGCEGYATVTVRVVNQASFVVPNAFSPNGDGLNETFKPLAVGYRELKYFRVFNRWGQEVYFSTTLESGWNGTYKNVSCDVGVYFWEISFIDRFGSEGHMKGDVTLLR